MVGYLHEWTPNGTQGGEFVLWDGSSRDGKVELPLPQAGSGVDGTKTVHAANVYYPDRVPPKISKDIPTTLKHRGNGEWYLVQDEDNKVLQNYTWDDLRSTIVYRARCFKDEEEAEDFRNHITDESRELPLDEILTRFATDLVAKGKVASVEAAMAMPRLDFSLLIMDTYVKYPMPVGLSFPWNYCAIPTPALQPILQFLCRQ